MEFDFASQMLRLVGGFPLLAVMLVGLVLAFFNRWRNPHVCTLVGIALLLALGTYVVLPVIMQVATQFMIQRGELEGNRWQLISLVHTFVYACASSVVWGLVLWAIFGRGGVVQSTPRFDDDD